MTAQYVAFTDTKTAAQRLADRKADEQWVRDHQPVAAPPEPPTYGALALVGSPAPSAH